MLQDEASASFAMYRKELLRVTKSLATALEKVKVSLMRAVAMTNKWNVATTEYKEQPLIMEQRVVLLTSKSRV